MQVDRNHPDWLAFGMIAFFSFSPICFPLTFFFFFFFFFFFAANTDYGFGEITIYNATTLRVCIWVRSNEMLLILRLIFSPSFSFLYFFFCLAL